MLIKHAFLQLQPVLLNKTAAMREKKIVPVDSNRYRYLRFRAIGNLEVPIPYGGFNGNWDGFLYEDFTDNEEGYGYRSFINKKAHHEHNSQLQQKGMIGDLPDAYLNKFNYEGIDFPNDIKVSSIQNNIDPHWSSILEPKYASLREKILNLPNQKDGAVEVLMRIDTDLLKKGKLESKTQKGLERIIRMIDTGQKISCSMGCFLPGTQITLSDGTIKYIENIRNGDEVISHKGVKRQVTESIVRSYDGYIVKINVVGLQRPLFLTPEHPILTKKKVGYCACGCGTKISTKYNAIWAPGHYQQVFNSNPKVDRDRSKDKNKKKELQKQVLEQVEWVEARDVTKKDYVIYPISQEEVEVSHITIGKARLIGYFLAEGSFVKYTNKQGDTYKAGVAFTFGNTEKDKSFVKETQELLQQEFGVNTPTHSSSEYISKEEAENRYGVAYNYGSTEVRASSKEAAQFFDFYCGEYAASKRLPLEVMTWPKELQKHLLATYFQGDGNQHFRGNCSLISAPTVSKDLAYQISYLLKRVGIPCTVNKRHYLYQPNPSYTIYIRGKWQNNLLDYWNYEKTKVKIHEENKSKSRFKITDNFILLPISNVEYEYYKGPVFNFEVEEDHSYIANGVTVHNCNVSYSTCSACGNKARFASDYCDHMKRGRKGSLSIVTANQVRDMLDKNILRLEWLKHIVSSKFDVDEILKGSSNKGIAVRNGEINHKLSFFELSVVGVPAFERADALEKVANKFDGDYEKFLKETRASLGDDVLVDLYSLLQNDGVISSGCEVKW